ncbi:MAG: calcium-binding protein, partial [Dongiaceae bacterium]
LQGGAGNDTLNSDGGNDTLNGGAGNDSLNGGTGNDIYRFGLSDTGTDRVDDTTGTDAIVIATTAGTALTTLGFERADGDADAAVDDLVINYNGQIISIVNHYAGQAVETIQFENGGSYLGYSLGTGVYQLGTDAATPLDPANPGNVQDVIASSSAAESLTGGNGNDLLFGNGQNDTINGQGGNDLLVGGAGTDSLDGGGGDDYIAGGSGNDTITGGGTNDDVIVLFTQVLHAGDILSNGIDTVNSFDAIGGAGSQDFIDLDALFDSLGFSNTDRAAGAGFTVVGGNQLWIDLDNNNATGAGGFEYQMATVNVISGAFDNADVTAGTA